MDMKIQDLLAFCSYYTLAKTSSKLSYANSSSIKRVVEEVTPKNQKHEKIVRKKFEAVESKKPEKVVKPKLEHVAKAANKNLSPIHQEDLKQIREDQNKKFDISYFMSHMTGHPGEYDYNSKIREQEGIFESKRPQNGLQNYQTFGRSRTKTSGYQTFEEKVRRQNKNIYPDRNERQQYPSQFIFKSDNKPNYNYDNNFWLYSQQIPRKNERPPFLQFNKKTPYNFGPTFEKVNAFQIAQSKLTYSPGRREYTPTGSATWTRVSPDSQLSKSRTKHQRKKSQRPFYDASKLTVKKEPQPIIRKNLYTNVNESKIVSQNKVAHQFVEVQQSHNFVNTRKNMVDPKRQTCTTAPPLRNNSEYRHSPHPQNNQTDLDDALQETLTELSRRKAPVGFELKIENGLTMQ